MLKYFVELKRTADYTDSQSVFTHLFIKNNDFSRCDNIIILRHLQSSLKISHHNLLPILQNPLKKHLVVWCINLK